MSAWWWSYTLAAVGVFGLWLTGRKMWQGFAVGVAVQFLWIAYAMVTEQWGFIGSALAFGWMNAWNLRKWLRERKAEKPYLGSQPNNPWVVYRERPAQAYSVIQGGKSPDGPCGYLGECLMAPGHTGPHGWAGRR